MCLMPGADLPLSDALSNSANPKLRIYVGGEKGWHESEIKVLNEIDAAQVSLETVYSTGSCCRCRSSL